MEKTFKNLKEIAAHLKTEGWKVAQSTVYEHGRTGKIRPDKGKAYSGRTVQRYAHRHLMLQQTRAKLGDDELQQRKLIAEVAKLTEHAKLAQIKRMAEEGKYILRSEVELELAGRAAVLDNRWTYQIQTEAPEIIGVVDGDPKRTGDLIRLLMDWKNDILNEFASTREFEVVMAATEEAEG